MSDLPTKRRSELSIASITEMTVNSWLTFNTESNFTKRITFGDFIRALFGGLKVFAVELTPAQIKDLNANPVDLVDAPGVGKAIEVLNASYRCGSMGAAAYTTNTTLELKNPSATIAQFRLLNGLAFTVASQRKLGEVVSSVVTDTQIVENEALQAFVPSGNPASGTSTITIFGTYRIIEF